jgi:hypothetical protein
MIASIFFTGIPLDPLAHTTARLLHASLVLHRSGLASLQSRLDAYRLDLQAYPAAGLAPAKHIAGPLAS